VRFGPKWALDEVNLEVPAGELVALAGENGAGKSTLVGCAAGDVTPTSGEILLEGRALGPRSRAAVRRGIGIVRQHTELCDNLDVAANLFLSREGRGLFFDQTALHTRAISLLHELKIPLTDTTTSVGSLSGGMRQLLAVARAMIDQPRLLILDEPTFSLGVMEAAQVEQLVTTLREQGTTILFVSHDVDQMFRLADRIVVLRHGRVVADLDPRTSHRDEVVALLSGQQVDSSARRQLRRLQDLMDQLASTDSSTSLSVILSSLGAALNTKSLCIHLREGDVLRCAASLGLPNRLAAEWAEVPYGSTEGPVGQASVSKQVVVVDDLELSAGPAPLRWLARAAKVESFWAVPVMGASGLLGVITILRQAKSAPQPDELDLVRLYAGYAASAIERDQLLNDVTARNSVLETIREVLETLAGPVPVPDALALALKSLRRGLQADQVLLLTRDRQDGAEDRYLNDGAVATGNELEWAEEKPSPALRQAANHALAAGPHDGRARQVQALGERCCVAATFPTVGGESALVASWRGQSMPEGSTALLEDAAHSLRLALEREEVAVAHQETAALRRSQEMQMGFLSRLSHELRTPLTAIRGYASSLLQPDVTWDGPSQQDFLVRVAAESARLGRLVEDMLDFSAIESGVFRLQSDWCDLPVVVEAAVACLPAASRAKVEVDPEPDLPAVWADHDRMEQVLLNLIDNALRHNPANTHVRVSVTLEGDGVAIVVADDGGGVPADAAAAFFDPKHRRRTQTSGAGLGLSIARGIVEAHGGQIELTGAGHGTRVAVRLPIEGPGRTTADVLGVPAGA